MRALALALALPLLACTLACTAKSEPDKRAKRSKPSEPTPLSLPGGPSPTPTASVPEPITPTPSEPTPTPAGEWWCVCYQAEADAGSQPETACRRSEAECRELETRIDKGGRGLVAGSRSVACRRLIGEHPGDATGGREVWRPSKLPGAWTSEGACLLADAGTGETGGTGELAEFGEDEIFAFLAGEAIGELRLDMPASEVVDLLGDPAEKGAIEEQGATGAFVQSWRYGAIGLQLDMHAPTRRGAQTLGGVILTAPSELKTKRGISIGSSWAEVVKAYADVQTHDAFELDDQSSFVAGSVYGGLIFSFEGDAVSAIFMGAAAE
ncbi:hypothetical protein ACNOYE_21455 [Nannocystaceae bacterium ST9]